MIPNYEVDRELSDPEMRLGPIFVQQEPSSFQGPNFLGDQQQICLLPRVSASEISTPSPSTNKDSKISQEFSSGHPDYLLNDIFSACHIAPNSDSSQASQQRFQVKHQSHPRTHQYLHHLEQPTVQKPRNNRQQCLLNKPCMDSNCFKSFCLFESQAHHAFLPHSKNQLSSEYCAESGYGGCFGTNIEGGMVDVLERSSTLPVTKTTSKHMSPEKSSNFADTCSLQPSPLFCVSTENVFQTTCALHTTHAPTANAFCRRGHSARQSLSSFLCTHTEDLHQPAARVDDLVRNCKLTLLNRGIQSSDAGNQELYDKMLRRLEAATGTNKSCERQRLKREFAESSSSGVKPSNMEAGLSRYKHNVCNVLLHYELKKISEHFTVLRKFVETHYSESVYNSEIPPHNELDSGGISEDGGSRNKNIFLQK